MEIWNKKRLFYLVLFAVLLLLEIFIAVFVHDNLVRPYIGDLLVVVLLYCLVRIFFLKSDKNTIFGVLMFALFVEFLQYMKFVEILNIQNNKLLSTIIGTTFDIKDIICYTLGAIIVYILELFKNTVLD